MEQIRKLIWLACLLSCASSGRIVADDSVNVSASLSTATRVAQGINSRMYARLLLFRLELVAALESGSSSLDDGTLFYKLKLDPELAAQEVAVFKRDGELLSGSAGRIRRLPTEVHKALDMSDGLRLYVQPSSDKTRPYRYQLFYPVSGMGAAMGDWSWVLYVEINVKKAIPEILDKLRLLRSENVLLYGEPDRVIFSFREDGIDFSASRSFRNKRRAVHEVTLTDLLRSDEVGEQRLTFLKESPPQMVDALVSWDKNGQVLGRPWIVVHSAKAYRDKGKRAYLNGEWEAHGLEASSERVLMAILTDSSNFKMILERPDDVVLSEGRFLKNSLTAHSVTAQHADLQVLSLSGEYAEEPDQITLRMVIKEGEKVKVSKYRFARSDKSLYKEPKTNHPQIKLRAFN